MSDKYPHLTDLQQTIIEELLTEFQTAAVDFMEGFIPYKKVAKIENNILYAVNQMVGGEGIDLPLTCIFLHEHKDDAQEEQTGS